MPEEYYEFTKKKGINVSQFLEEAIKCLISKLPEDTKLNGAQIIVISSKEGQNECLQPELNRRHTDLQSVALPTEL